MVGLITERDSKGRFTKNRILDTVTETKRLSKLKEAAKLNPNYLGELKESPLYNIWRSFKFTKKGKMIGNDPYWDKFQNFYNDIIDMFEEGKRLCRIDTDKPFSKSNIVFLTDKESGSRNMKQLPLVYNNEEKGLKEWSVLLDIPYCALAQRYRKGIIYGHSSERILFGNKYIKPKEVKSQRQISEQAKRTKASKMLSSYRHSDKRKGLSNDLDIEWMILEIFNHSCTYCGEIEKIGADRIDNNIGHLKTNCVPACYTCNITRGNNFSFEEMKELGKAIKIIRTNRVKM